MDWKTVAPYIVPVLVAALLARRVIRAQQARTIRPSRLWILPAILLVATAATLMKEPAPGLPAIAALILAACAGGALGWYRVHTLQFSADPETGAITSKATPLGAFLIVGLLLARYAIKYVEQDGGLARASLVRWADGGLIFSAAMMIAQSAHTWVRARNLLSGTAAPPTLGGEGGGQ